jgi:hypothetical protein
MSSINPKQPLVGRVFFPADNVETRLVESVEHFDSQFHFRFWQESQRPQTVCDFRSDRSRYDRDGFVREHLDRL